MALSFTPQPSTLAAADDSARSARYASNRPWIISGLALSAGTGLNVAISAGVSWIAGYYLDWDASSEIALSAASTNYVYLTIQRDVNDNVTGVSFVVNTTGTPPTDDHAVLGTATTDGSAVTGTATTGRSPQTQVEPSASNWGSIGGTLADQTDLQGALDAKVGTTGNETIDGIKTFSAIPVVPNDSFAFAKLQNIATARILGRVTASTGDIQELTQAQLLTFLGLGAPPRANASTTSQTITLGTNTNVTNLVINSGLVNSTAYAFDVTLFCNRTGAAANSNLVVNFLLANVTNIYGGFATTYQSAVGFVDNNTNFVSDRTVVFWITTGTDKATVRISGRFITAASGTPSVQLRCKMSDASGYDTILANGSNIRAIPI